MSIRKEALTLIERFPPSLTGIRESLISQGVILDSDSDPADVKATLDTILDNVAQSLSQDPFLRGKYLPTFNQLESLYQQLDYFTFQR